MKVFARKQKNITESDCVSTGAAARGHILEPFAIDKFNLTGICPDKLYHWDDLMVSKDPSAMNGLAFSPDAMSVPPTSGDKVEPEYIAEVKCYAAEKHLICGYSNKMDLEERWQIAVAMAVAKTVQTAYLLFYNPSMESQLFVVEYDREDLEREIDIVNKIEDDWKAWLSNLSKLDRNVLVTGNKDDERKIIDKIIKEEELNPEGEKSVML